MTNIQTAFFNRKFIFSLLALTFLSLKGYSQCATLTITPDHPIICDTAVVITATATGGSSPYSYLWNTGQTTQSIKVNTGGVYIVSVSSQSCGVVTDSILVRQITVPVAWNTGPVCTGKNLYLTAANFDSVTYNWKGPNGFSTFVQNPVISNVTLANAGVYSVTITSNNGCTSFPGLTTVVVNSTPLSPKATNNGPLCLGQTLNLNAENVTGGSYNWIALNGFSSAIQNPVISNVSLSDSGKYYVTVTVNGCTSDPDSTDVLINSLPLAPAAGNNSPICSGTSLNLTATTIPNATYNWSGPNNFTSGIQNPVINNTSLLNGGTYSVTATVNGCTGSAGFTTVIIKPTPVVTANNNGPLCVGQTLNLSATSFVGGTYNWTGPNNFSSSIQNPVINNVSTANAGVYNVTVTVNGCTSLVAATVVVINSIPPSPFPGSNSPVCSGTSITLSASNVTGGIYSWTGPNNFISSAQNPVISNAIISNAGIYNVTVTVNGCTSPSASTQVIVNPIPATPVALNNSPICVGQTLNLSVNSISGATYNWQGPNGFTSSQQNPAIINSSLADSGMYAVTVTVNGCTSLPATTNAIIRPVVSTPSVTSNSPVCSGNSLILGTPYIAGIVYSWSGPNGFTSSMQNPVINNVTVADAGLYNVTITGCNSKTNSTAVVINQTPPVPVTTNNGPLCSGQTLNLSAQSLPGAGYSWTGPNGFISTAQNPVINNVSPANTGIYAVIASLNGCTGLPGNTTVSIDAPPVVNAGNNQTVCADNSFINLNGSVTGGSTTGIWSTSGTGSFSPSNTDLSPSYYFSNADKVSGSVTLTLTSTNNGACVASSAFLRITITPAITSNAGPDQQICASQNSINLNGVITVASGGLWSTSGSGIFSPDNSTLNGVYLPSAGDKQSGTVILTLTSTGNGNCNAASDAMTIFISPGPTVNAGPDIFILQNNTIVLQPYVGNSAIKFLWSPNLYISNDTIKNPVLTGINDQLYTLTVTDAFGCSSQDQVFVKVLKSPKVPNTFTPNNDGINDTWIITNLESYPSCRVQVFDRYGQLIFQSYGYAKPWDGTRNGKPLPIGTYYYIIEPGEGVKPVSGFVTIIK